MNLIALPAFSDNYIWMLHDGQRAVVVDPGESAPVIEALDSHRLELAAILVTHHHADHVGGIADLRPRLQGAVYGPRRERIPEPFVALDDGDAVEVLGLRFAVIDVPGHTSGHIAYFTEEGGGAPILFCGDTLFSGGCGRLFEGTPAQMHHSLSRLAGLPGATRVCCAHEYTLSNLKFARAVEPVNAALADYTAWCEAQRANGQPTLPSSIATERLVNPFLRCAEPGVALTAQARGAPNTDPVAVLAALRQWKNEFR
ncbi:MAG: hydroxyacylglutathione hydrolase [Burkholderiaceae bacterium]